MGRNTCTSLSKFSCVDEGFTPLIFFRKNGKNNPCNQLHFIQITIHFAQKIILKLNIWLDWEFFFLAYNGQTRLDFKVSYKKRPSPHNWQKCFGFGFFLSSCRSRSPPILHIFTLVSACIRPLLEKKYAFCRGVGRVCPPPHKKC